MGISSKGINGQYDEYPGVNGKANLVSKFVLFMCLAFSDTGCKGFMKTVDLVLIGSLLSQCRQNKPGSSFTRSGECAGNLRCSYLITRLAMVFSFRAALRAVSFRFGCWALWVLRNSCLAVLL